MGPRVRFEREKHILWFDHGPILFLLRADWNGY